MECCNCGAPAEHLHHIVPKAVGGTDRSSNLAPLCEDCHGLVHDRRFVRHRELSAAGVEAARAAGKKIGRRYSYSAEQLNAINEMSQQGKSVRSIAAALGLSKSAVGRVIAG